jgi:hypothetical protein
MALEQKWQTFMATGRIPVSEAGDSALAYFYLALFAVNRSDYAEAYALSRHASECAPEHLLLQATTRYLRQFQVEKPIQPYQQADSFTAFIRGGGNIRLYQQLSSRLCAIYNEYNKLTLLEIGVGDGQALLPALSPTILHIDLVEPSAAMLALTRAALDARGIAYRAFHQSIQTFAAAGEAQLYDIAQATFSLQALAPEERADILRWLRSRCARLLVAEFNVPTFSHVLHPERVRFMVERYAQGIAEYTDEGDLVIQGFLMPMFFSAFSADRSVSNHEQPATAWRTDLHNAGFQRIDIHAICDYWWSPAVLLDAR